jgi:hypothetical protein
MATDRLPLLEQLGKAAAGGDVDFLRSAVKTIAEAFTGLEVSAKLGAAPHEPASAYRAVVAEFGICTTRRDGAGGPAASGRYSQAYCSHLEFGFVRRAEGPRGGRPCPVSVGN